MLVASRLGTLSLAIGVVLGLVGIGFAVWRRNAAGALLLAALLPLHPGWWVSAYIGDCGGSRFGTSFWGTLVIAFVVLAPGVLFERGRWSSLGVAVQGMLAICALTVAVHDWHGLALMVPIPSLLAGYIVLVERWADQPFAPAVRQLARSSGTRRRLVVETAAVAPMAILFVLLTGMSAFNSVRAMPSGGALEEIVRTARWVRGSDTHAR